jgi:predicted GNAT family N-acyltransferase
MACSSSSTSTIEIRPLAIEHRQHVIDLLMCSFFLEEPINAILQFDIPNEPLPWICHVVEQSLRDQCSFVAIDTQIDRSHIIGVILNGLSHRNHRPMEFQIESDKLKFIFALIDRTTSNIDLFDIYRTDCLFHCNIINVDSSQRGRNISQKLISASMSRASDLNIQAAFVICSNLYSRKAFERIGFNVLNEISYADYERLTDMGVHDRCTLLGKRL